MGKAVNCSSMDNGTAALPHQAQLLTLDVPCGFLSQDSRNWKDVLNLFPHLLLKGRKIQLIPWLPGHDKFWCYENVLPSFYFYLFILKVAAYWGYSWEIIYIHQIHTFKIFAFMVSACLHVCVSITIVDLRAFITCSRTPGQGRHLA